jgi:hypothetical protein
LLLRDTYQWQRLGSHGLQLRSFAIDLHAAMPINTKIPTQTSPARMKMNRIFRS